MQVCPGEVEKWGKTIFVNKIAAADLLLCFSRHVRVNQVISLLSATVTGAFPHFFLFSVQVMQAENDGGRGITVCVRVCVRVCGGLGKVCSQVK
jgi:hypothetical protein